MSRILVSSFVWFVLAPLVSASELEIQFGAVERVLGQQMFTHEGRLYVRGSATTKCKFAYIETPHVGGSNGMLRITGRFSGRTALDMFGRCVGLGESFEFSMLAVPVVRDGGIGLKDVTVTTPRDSYYIRKVRQAMEQSMMRNFRVDVQSHAHRLLDGKPVSAQGEAVYQHELAGFQLRDVRATPEAIVLDVDFRLIVK